MTGREIFHFWRIRPFFEFCGNSFKTRRGEFVCTSNFVGTHTKSRRTADLLVFYKEVPVHFEKKAYFVPQTVWELPQNSKKIRQPHKKSCRYQDILISSPKWRL